MITHKLAALAVAMALMYSSAVAQNQSDPVLKEELKAHKVGFDGIVSKIEDHFRKLRISWYIDNAEEELSIMEKSVEGFKLSIVNHEHPTRRWQYAVDYMGSYQNAKRIQKRLEQEWAYARAIFVEEVVFLENKTSDRALANISRVYRKEKKEQLKKLRAPLEEAIEKVRQATYRVDQYLEAVFVQHTVFSEKPLEAERKENITLTALVKYLMYLVQKPN